MPGVQHHHSGSTLSALNEVENASSSASPFLVDFENGSNPHARSSSGVTIMSTRSHCAAESICSW